MTTVSCTVMSGGSVMDRATINKQQFVEATGMVGSGVVDDVKVGSGKEVLVVDSWTPEEDSHDVPHGHSVQVDLHATADTAELEVLFDEGQDFEDGGTHDDTETVGDAVQLKIEAPETDFEDFSDGLITGATQPQDFTSLSAQDNNHSGDWLADGNNEVKALYWSYNLVVRYDEPGTDFDYGVSKCRFRFDGNSGRFRHYFCCTGSGSALRGHFQEIEVDSAYSYFGRVNNDNHTTNIRFDQHNTPVPEDEWWWLKCSFGYDGARVYSTYKIWKDGDAEPGSYRWGGDDPTYYQHGGAFAIGTWHSSYNQVYYWDDLSVVPAPAIFVLSGEWTSDPIDVSPVGHYSHCLVTWDEVEPTDTEAKIKVRWRGSDSWVEVTNGGEVPGIERGYNMEEGSPYEDLEFQVALTTSDDSETPTVENVRFYFEPVSEEALLIDLDGDIECTVANGLLDYWHRNHVVGAATVLDWDDIKIQTEAGRWVTTAGKGVTIALKYGGVVIDEIVYAVSKDFWMESPDFAGYYWGMTPLVYEAAPIQARWNVQDPWTPGSHIFEWVLVDKNLAMHADTWYIVGRPQRDDHPMSWLVAALNIHDHPLSIQPRGWARNDHPMSMLIQGWARNDFPLSMTVGEWTVNDQPVSMLVGIRYLNDHPLSMVVYGVNREGSIVVNVIDDNTHQTLLDHGITFS